MKASITASDAGEESFTDFDAGGEAFADFARPRTRPAIVFAD
ncbi:hypothetical protein [Amycolatopsis saalfeldensis]|uniref:Uncharacterized protein n=1 Tax=Amycolatopsis saalfeldensis TaxID=394193 RepID=A0A1H8UIG1_9PSEU|nr:hypothetical protein [Amycolatopsis saalfeldensis]SEP02975.1 hypothetical protein SAMN04489732_103299 [Amycolatopsis saalfeldensis]